ncbi:YciI family protein [Amnibacterium endophyticum]|uniref:YciI family protein n=1 Tax=Amnibacterium endophyticum TaxID=2109337 RepID=A0ABW4LH00_9MICO
MSKYLISFPSAAMRVGEDELAAVGDAARAVVREAKDAGVWVFGGGIDESVPPVLVDREGRVTDGTYPQTTRIEGGYAVIEVPTREAAVCWAARLADACRCAQELRVFGDDPDS